MNITMLYGDSRPASECFDRFLHAYRMKLTRTGQYVRVFNIREMKLNEPALGYKGGSGKPAGAGDDFRYIENALKETDLFVLAATPDTLSVVPVLKLVRERVAGWKTASADRPDVFLHNEASDSFPMVGLILNTESGAGEQDVLLNRLAGERLASDLRTVFSFCVTTEFSPLEVACETFRSLNYRHHLEKTCDDLILGVG
jgi:hypothetical protein